MGGLDLFDYEIRPLVGVGPIRFGQLRSDVLRLLGTPSRRFKKVPFALTETDAFNEAGLHVYYDPTYRVESIDAVAPSMLSLEGISFLGRRVQEVVQEMERRGYRSESLTFDDAGVSLFEEDGAVKCVTVFPRGYFDLTDPDSPMSRAKTAAATWFRGQAGRIE